MKAAYLKNYYEILGLKMSATPEDVRAAYRKLALKFHPDKNDGDSFLMEMFKSVQEAYEVLSDENKKENYDRDLSEFIEGKQGSSHTTHSEQNDSSEDGIDDNERVPAREASRFSNGLRVDLDAYFAAMEDRERKTEDYAVASATPKPKYVNIKVFLMVIGIIFLMIILRPHGHYKSKGKIALQNQDKMVVFAKPDISSDTLRVIPATTTLSIIGETTYFNKVQFLLDTSGNYMIGYVRK